MKPHSAGGFCFTMYTTLALTSFALQPSMPSRVFPLSPGSSQILAHNTLFIEAEDFNFSNDGTIGGLYANFGDVDCSLLGKRALLNVDYLETDVADAQPFYRAPTGVDTRPLGAVDDVRAERTNTCDYAVAANQAGDWYNYTRIFPLNEQSFGVYLRGRSGSGARVRLDRVEAATTTNQAITFLGTFEISPSASTNVFSFCALQVENPDFPVIRVCGETTLRLTVIEGAPELNYLALVPMSGPLDRSQVQSVYPPAGSRYARAPLIKVVLADWETAVIPSSIRLFVDCVEETTRATITNLPSGAMISYQMPTGSPLSVRHDIHVEWQDTGHCGLPALQHGSFYFEGPYNPEMNLFIEAEDFDANNGQYFPSHPATTNDFNRKGLYQGAAAVHDIDYHFEPQPGAQVAYRTGLNPAVGMREAVDTRAGERLGFETAVDYRVAWNAAGDWYNYTRFWSGQPWHHVYLRASHEMTNNHNHGALSLVETTGAIQTLGVFEGLPSGNWDIFTFVPLRNSFGNLAAVRLTGQQTLRYTAPPVAVPSADINYIMFVPFPNSVAGPPFVRVRRCDIDGTVQLTFAGELQWADAITGPWQTVNGANSPLVIRGSIPAQRFWRVGLPE